MLSREQLIKSCKENHLTSLLCAQGYEATEDCNAMVAKWYGAELLDEFVDEIWDSGITIKNARIAEYIGRTKVAEFYQTTCAKDVEEFISECSTGFSGTPIDGSPFTRDDSDDYAREYWEAHHVED